jgi:cytochrome c oxidase assembly protein subunit 15
MFSDPPPLATSRWPHRWAWVLACATFPLVWWGGLVTATGSGMAFRDWLTSDGVFMPLYPWLSSAGEKFIEHGHRILAMLTGLLTIGLVVVCARREPRLWVRTYSLGLLAGVLAQGVLGGMRVLLDERVLALLHGCIGPLFFAATAGMAAITSPGWTHESAGQRVVPAKLLRLAVLTATLTYLQLVLGAIVRHSPFLQSDSAASIFQAAVYFHVVMAAAAAVHVVWLVIQCCRFGVCVLPSLVLAGLTLAQFVLGASSWIVKYGMPSWATRLIGETGHFNRADDLASAAVLAGHGAVGALIVALAVVIALRVGRLLRVQSPAAAPVPMTITGAPA